MTIQKLTSKQLGEKLNKGEKILLLDVRAKEKFNDDHIEHENMEVTNIPKTEIFNENMEEIELLPKEQEIIVTCTTGNSAAKCAAILSEKGYKVVVLEGGITAWKETFK